MGSHKYFVLVDRLTLLSTHLSDIYSPLNFLPLDSHFYVLLYFSYTFLEHTFASVTLVSLQFPGHVSYPCLPTPECTFTGLGSVQEMEHTTSVCISLFKIVVLAPEYTFTRLGSIYEIEQTTFICLSLFKITCISLFKIIVKLHPFSHKFHNVFFSTTK